MKPIINKRKNKQSCPILKDEAIFEISSSPSVTVSAKNVNSSQNLHQFEEFKVKSDKISNLKNSSQYKHFETNLNYSKIHKYQLNFNTVLKSNKTQNNLQKLSEKNLSNYLIKYMRVVLKNLKIYQENNSQKSDTTCSQNGSLINLDMNLDFQAPLAKQESINDVTLNVDDFYFDDSIYINPQKCVSIRNSDKILESCSLKRIKTNFNPNNYSENLRIKRTSTPRQEFNSKQNFSSFSTENFNPNYSNTTNSLAYSFCSYSSNLQNGRDLLFNFDSSCYFLFNKTKSDLKVDICNLQNNITSTTNFTSIEKLELIKPQSKDYILCFDTSSIIDQNSSDSSSINLRHFETENGLNLTDRGLTNSNEIRDDKFISNVDGKIISRYSIEDKLVYDSGVDTARTLSPQI